MVTNTELLNLLEAVCVLHERGFEGVRVLPHFGGPGYWRLVIAPGEGIDDQAAFPRWDPEVGLAYSVAGQHEFADGEFGPDTTPEELADMIIAVRPEFAIEARDPSYTGWLRDLVTACRRTESVPIAFDEYSEPGGPWTISGTGTTYRRPPPQTDSA
ncbi:hypothetical protein GOHSU_16_00990 [Gordonia hirsuta DSM 44140 = NBRC 16056]|uniref:Uncharacterized protein n=1 Tax=Gordonia hirsuta DSM 44140 = NBRC 16056 TaxID=1121927 RepID=L7L8R6_9ACTN|nr:hypothetical protein [Gordonia hirsuta]GAC57141.1 hypothetical protein GOHSU_16_00990 [Gordonia hirsuta DSM 44140 = NBRC 16056]